MTVLFSAFLHQWFMNPTESDKTWSNLFGVDVTTPGSTKLTGPSTGCSCVSCTFVAWGSWGLSQGHVASQGLSAYSGQVCEWIACCCSLQSHTDRWRRTVALLTCLRTSFNESLVGLVGLGRLDLCSVLEVGCLPAAWVGDSQGDSSKVINCTVLYDCMTLKSRTDDSFSNWIPN